MNDFSNIKLVKQPQNLKIQLYPHQLASIYNMEQLELNNIIHKETYVIETKIGVISDIPGFGKSLSMIGLILRDKMNWDINIPYIYESLQIEAKNRVKKCQVKYLKKIPTTLILVSPNILCQWEKEIKNTDLKFVSLIKKKDIDTIKVYEYDVIFVVPVTYNLLILKYQEYAWKRFIFDEPGHLKVPSMKEIHAGFYWFVTATPNAISNLHRKCENSFMKDIINNRWTDFESQFSYLIFRNDPEFIKSSYNMPQTYHFKHECYQPMFNILKNYVNEKIRTMIEAGNIGEAILHLGGKKTDNIIEVVKSKKNEELLEINTKIQIYRLRNDNSGAEHWEDKKKRVLQQLSDIELKFENMLNDSCSICYNILNKPILEPNCQYLFCGQCFFKWLEINNSCPMCRHNINIQELIYIDTDNINNNNKNEIIMTKTEKIVDLIKKNVDGRFLIFSQHDDSFYPISKALIDNKILFSEIKGNIKRKEKNIFDYKIGKVSVIFLNSNVNCAGLNLEETTDIILYHEMNTHTENQIIGRALRIGRKTHLNVHHLI